MLDIPCVEYRMEIGDIHVSTPRFYLVQAAALVESVSTAALERGT